ncbi:hypothetical protein ACFFRR_011903 [Megaselia abdita]
MAVKVNVFLCVIISVIPISLSIPLETPGHNLIETVSNEDKGFFILYNLCEGINSKFGRTNINLSSAIPKDKVEKFKNMNIPGSFSTNLLRWTQNKLNLNNSDINQLRTTYSQDTSTTTLVCTGGGYCFNPNDIGAMCCPF